MFKLNYILDETLRLSIHAQTLNIIPDLHHLQDVRTYSYSVTTQYIFSMVCVSTIVNV